MRPYADLSAKPSPLLRSWLLGETDAAPAIDELEAEQKRLSEAGARLAHSVLPAGTDLDVAAEFARTVLA